MGPKTRLISATAGLLLLAFPAESVAQSQTSRKNFNIGGTQITFPMPSGMCLTSRRHPRDRAVHEYMDRANAGRSRILMIIVECKELRAYRAKKLELLGNYGMTAIPSRMITRQIRQPRATFIRQMTAFFRGRGMAMLENKKDDYARRIEGALPGLKVNQQKFLGVLHTDKDGLHLGFLQKLTFPTIGTVVVAGVFSMTVLKGKMIGLYRYKHYKGLDTIANLMNLQKSWVAQSVKVNHPDQRSEITTPNSAAKSPRK